MKTPELKSGYWSVDYLKLLANGEAHLSETSLRQCAEYIEAAYKAIDLLESRLAQVERERDAAVRAISDAKHYIKDLGAISYGLQQLENWDYSIKKSGVCEENTKEEEK